MSVFDQGGLDSHQDFSIFEERSLFRKNNDHIQFERGNEIDEQTDPSLDTLPDDLDDPDIEHWAPKDVVSSISGYRKVWSQSKEDQKLQEMYANKTVEEMLRDYHNPEMPKHLRNWLKKEVFYRIFFLLPHAVKKHYHISINNFDDAMQNMSHNVLVAMESFNPNLGKTFVNYLAGYLKAAITRTFRDTNVIAIPTARRKILKEAVAQEQATEKEPEVSYPKMSMYDDTSNAGMGAFSNTGGAPWEQRDFDATIHNRQLVEWLEEALSKEAGVLTTDERRVLIMHCGLFGEQACTYQEIAKLHEAEGKGHACSRLSQISTQAIKKLRVFFAQMELERY